MIGRLQFEGNKKLKDADLEKAIELAKEALKNYKPIPSRPKYPVAPQ